MKPLFSLPKLRIFRQLSHCFRPAFRPKMIFFGWLTLLLLGVFAHTADGQPKLQVVTKTVEKELAYTEGQRISLLAQKADVVVKGWAKSTISVRLKLIAKHPDRQIAEQELTYLQYTIQASGNLLTLSNQVLIPPRAGTLQGTVKTSYEVWVPFRCPLILANTFGDIHLRDLSDELVIQFEFGKLALTNLSGKTTITSAYGDIDADELSGTFTIRAEKAEITLNELRGSGSIQSRYGTLHIRPDASLSALTVRAARTQVVLQPKRLSDFQYDLDARYSTIRVPDGSGEPIMGKHRFVYNPSGKPRITIANSYSPIVLEPGVGGTTVAK